jgi:ABC-2 type transport system ATP-binding protein
VPEPALQIRDLTKRYGDRTALNGISLDLAQGQLLALLGVNGAGKTTTIEICEGLRRPDSGHVRVLGLAPEDNALRPRVSIMLQDGVGAYTGARALELLQLFASYAADPLDPITLLDLVGLGDSARTLVKRLSGGQQQRLSLAMALVSRPELLFLDEPTAGMDPHARRITWDLVRSLRADGVSIVLTTHHLDEAEELADHVVVLHAGEVVAAGTPAELTRSQEPGSSGEVRFSAPMSIEAARLRQALPITSEVRRDGAQIVVSGIVTPDLLVAITSWCAEQGVLAEGLSVGRRSLEDVFMALTSDTVYSPTAEVKA